jgi:hypothetical protein
MPNDITVQPVATVRPVGDALEEMKISPTARAPPSQPVATPPPTPNPTMRLDPALGMVVIEFHNTSGALTTSIPSQRQLAAYQKWSVTHFGPNPSGPRAGAQQVPSAPKVEAYVPAAATPHDKGK